MKTRSHKIINKGRKKTIDRDDILKRIEKEKKFQKQQQDKLWFNYGFTLSKNQTKKLYENLISSIDKVVELNKKIGVKSNRSGGYNYFKEMLKRVNEDITRSQNKFKRIVLTEKCIKKSTTK